MQAADPKDLQLVIQASVSGRPAHRYGPPFSYCLQRQLAAGGGGLFRTND